MKWRPGPNSFDGIQNRFLYIESDIQHDVVKDIGRRKITETKRYTVCYGSGMYAAFSPEGKSLKYSPDKDECIEACEEDHESYLSENKRRKKS